LLRIKTDRVIFFVAVFLALGVLSLNFFTASAVSPDQIKRGIRFKLGLEPDLYDVIKTDYQGKELVLTVIFLDERVLDSSLDPKIKEAARNNRDRGALFISAFTDSEGIKFHPYALRILQKGKALRARSVVGITEGFEQGAMPSKISMRGKDFWGNKGIVVFGQKLNSEAPFDVKYGSNLAHFNLKSPQRIEDSVDEDGQRQQKQKENGAREISPQGEGKEPQPISESDDSNPEATGPKSDKSGPIKSDGGENDKQLQGSNLQPQPQPQPQPQSQGEQQPQAQEGDEVREKRVGRKANPLSLLTEFVTLVLLTVFL